MSDHEVGVGATMLVILFGANFFIWLYLWILDRLSAKVSSEESEGENKIEKAVPKTKELSKPFTPTLEGIQKLSTELLRFSIVLSITYICEYEWIFPHSQKSYSRDLFLFVVLLFFGYGFYTIKPTKDLSLLSRDQTEEWKGWMQFIFLLYHYFHAEEVYNSVRVMITCYVWMTGFGNFSFFYVKQDFGWLRVVQMLWRLNFAVLFLMWTHGNTYILYYICPLHTFYFLVVYITMYIASNVNHSQYGIRIKLMVLGFVLWLVWDMFPVIFDLIFGLVLGTDRTIGASNGSLYEYYFRTSLDHYSSFFGMIFALNFPVAEEFFKRSTTKTLCITGAILFAMSAYWYMNIYQLDKFAYNLDHSYWAFVPLTAYIFFRNITPSVRSGVSMSMHMIGKTTLETYLLQHHVWLTSNAKTLLTVVPDQPWVNFFLATILFYVLAKELYRLTMSLRGMILPDNEELSKWNMLGMAVVLLIGFALSYTLHSVGLVSIFSSLALSVVLFCAFVGVCMLWIPSIRNLAGFGVYLKHTFAALALLLVVLLGFHHVAHSIESTSVTTPALLNPAAIPYCLKSVTTGAWGSLPCSSFSIEHGGAARRMLFSDTDHDTFTREVRSLSDIASATSELGYCRIDQWKWDDEVAAKCHFHRVSSSSEDVSSFVLHQGDAQHLAPSVLMLRNKRIVFIGDSIIRSIYHSMNTAISADYVFDVAGEIGAKAHQNLVSNFAKTSASGLNISVAFYWAPTVPELSAAIANGAMRDAHMVFMGAALWDALYGNGDVNAYSQNLQRIQFPVSHAFKAWIQPTTLLSERFNVTNKELYMNEEIIAKFRQIAGTVGNILNNVDTIIDPTSISYSAIVPASSSLSSSAQLRVNSGALDGIHYTDEVYAVIAQVLLNSYFTAHSETLRVRYSQVPPKPYSPKATGGMSFPIIGFVVLIFAAIMLFTMDDFLGTGALAFKISALPYPTWEEVYIPLHNTIPGLKEKLSAVKEGAHPPAVSKEEEQASLLSEVKESDV